MIALHQVRAVSLTGYIEVARFVGLDPYAMLAVAGISPSSLDDPEMRLPAGPPVEMLEESARRSGCENFGLLMAECRTFESIGPITLLLKHLGSIREVLEATLHFRRHISDIIDLRISDHEDSTLIELAMLPEFAGPQVVTLTVAMTHVLLAGASRGSWKARTVHFRHKAPADRGVLNRFFPAPIQFDSTMDGFECDRSMLDRRLPGDSRVMAQHAIRLLNRVELQPDQPLLSDSVVRSIALLLSSGRGSLEAVSASLDIAPRSLQRQLDIEGNSFGKLLNKARRELTIRYLSNPSQPIASVADLTGYASASSFTRWFASEFGQSPKTWRDSRIAGSIAA